MCGLHALGVPAASLTSLSSKEASAQVYGQLEAGSLRLLYVTPERVVGSKRLLSKLEKAAKVGQGGGGQRVSASRGFTCSNMQ